jgi:hypothetical protein
MLVRSIPLRQSRRSLIAVALLAAVSLGLATHTLAQDSDNAKRGRKYKPPPATSHVEITVVRATTGKPIENASVIFHPLQDGKNAGNMELKTNDEGKTAIDLLAIGSDVRLQIIAPGYQTYGQDYRIDKDKITLEVKMERPGSQYSIYKKGEGKATEPGQRPNTSSPDAAPATPKDESKPEASKPQDSSTPQSTTPQSTTPQGK